jgi:hypothetical protein
MVMVYWVVLDLRSEQDNLTGQKTGAANRIKKILSPPKMAWFWLS